MRVTQELTDSAVARILGARLARYRIETRLTQAELAERAGIGKRTVERLEAGLGVELVTLIRVLRTLNILGGFERLLPELPPGPIAQLELRGEQRRRVSHPRGRTVSQRAPAQPWRWEQPHNKVVPPAKGSRSTKAKA